MPRAVLSTLYLFTQSILTTSDAGTIIIFILQMRKQRERERLKKQSCWSQDWNTVSVNSVHPCGKPVQQKYVCNAVKFLRTEVSPLSFEPRGISAQICLSKGSRWVSGPQVGVWLLANLLQCGELGIQEAEMKLLHLLSGSFQIYGALSATGEFRVTRKNAFGCVWMVSPS